MELVWGLCSLCIILRRGDGVRVGRENNIAFMCSCARLVTENCGSRTAILL